MQQLLAAFGINWQLLAAQAVNFGIVLIALWYFLYKPVAKILNERQQLIEKSVEDAAKTSEIYAHADEEAHGRIQRADTEAESILAAARDAAGTERARLMKDAEARAANIAKDAEARASDLMDRTARESDREIARLAMLATEKLLNEKP